MDRYQVRDIEFGRRQEVMEVDMEHGARPDKTPVSAAPRSGDGPLCSLQGMEVGGCQRCSKWMKSVTRFPVIYLAANSGD